MKKILLIEDNSEIRENTSEILGLAHYEVVTAPNGKVGVALAQKATPDLIICDIMMPELDGYGVLHILSKRVETARIPFIFLTAKTEKTDIRKGMSLGADDYLTKPFDDTDLLTAIETRLRKSDMQLKDYSHNAEGLDHFIKDAQHVLNLKDLCRDKKTKLYKKKADVFMEGDLPNTIYFIKSGSIKTYKTNIDGKELITNLYKTGDYFGFESLLENTSQQDSAIAMEDTELVSIPKHDFLTLMQSQRDVSATFISLLCKKVSEKEAQLLTLAYNSVRQRTAEALLKMNAHQNAKEALSVPREDLAKMVGTAPESVIRVLSDFKDEGIIEIIAGKIIIKSAAKLEQVVKWNVARG